jgi:hypothetical protein
VQSDDEIIWASLLAGMLVDVDVITPKRAELVCTMVAVSNVWFHKIHGTHHCRSAFPTMAQRGFHFRSPI